MSLLDSLGIEAKHTTKRSRRTKTTHYEAIKLKQAEPEPFQFCDSWSNPQEASMSTLTETVVIAMNPSKAALIMRASHNEAFINAMKKYIPTTQRTWDQQEKAWLFHPQALPELKRLVPIFYAGFQIIGVQKSLPVTKFDQLMNKLTTKDKQALYVVLAKRFHPDTGGDPETMILVNSCFKD